MDAKLFAASLIGGISLILSGCGKPETCSPSFITSYTDSCLTDEEIRNLGNTPKITVAPGGATFVEGESRTFQISGGFPPLYAQVFGCLGGTTSCERGRLDGSDRSFPGDMFLLEQSGRSGRTVNVVFVDDHGLQPASVVLRVWGSDRLEHADRETTVTVPFDLFY